MEVQSVESRSEWLICGRKGALVRLCEPSGDFVGQGLVLHLHGNLEGRGLRFTLHDALFELLILSLFDDPCYIIR